MRSFFLTALGVPGVILLAMIGVNVWVDPYGMAANVGLPTGGYTPITWSRVAAAERLREEGCDIALLGSSRIVMGYGTGTVEWAGRRVCNGALGGTSLQELETAFDLVVEQTDIRRVVLFVDFHMFNPRRGTYADWTQSRFNPNRGHLEYWGWGLSSYEAGQRAYQSWSGHADWSEEQAEGLLHLATSAQIAGYLSRNDVYRDWPGYQQELDRLDQLVQRSMDADVEVTIVIPPVHALLYETIGHARLWAEFIGWKHNLAKLAGRYRDDSVQVWDFATYHAAAVEPLPLYAGDTESELWRDMSHMTPRLGMRLLTVLGRKRTKADHVTEDAFGVRLLPAMMREHVLQMTAGRTRWHRERPDQFAWFQATIQEMERKRKIPLNYRQRRLGSQDQSP